MREVKTEEIENADEGVDVAEMDFRHGAIMSVSVSYSKQFEVFRSNLKLF